MNTQSTPSKSTIFSAMALVAGTCIGGGMLALPVSSGTGGLLPSMLWLLVSWLAMTATSLLLLEANLWMKEGQHVISMAHRFLGPFGSGLSWVLYLFICYASLVGYAAGGGVILASALDQHFGLQLEPSDAVVIFTVVFTLIVYLGAKILGRVNAILFIAMMLSYLLLVVIGLDEVKPALFYNMAWVSSTLSIPFLLTSFSHQTMVPSLTPYLHGHAKSLRSAIIGGTSIAFIVYSLWLVLMLGIVPPDGPKGLIEAFLTAMPATEFISAHVQGSWIVPIANFFSFFAIVTSFLGIALGLFDFLSDGLSIQEKGMGRIWLGLLIMIPTIFCALYFERIFLVAFETTGGIGDAILNGMIPILMVVVGRYKLGYKSEWSLPGGKGILAVLFLFFAGTFLWEICILAFDLALSWYNIL